MLEILMVRFFCKLNGKMAAARGRNPRNFQILTACLWFGGEIFGFSLAFAIFDFDTLSSYLTALGFAVSGMCLSFVISKICKKGNYVHAEHDYNIPLAYTRYLTSPCNLTILRESSFAGSLVKIQIFLDGQMIGTLKNGQSLRLSTNREHHFIYVKIGLGGEIRPIYFAVQSGGNAILVFNAERFIHNKCSGIYQMTNQEVNAYSGNTSFDSFESTQNSVEPGNPPIERMTTAESFQGIENFQAAYEKSSVLVKISSVFDALLGLIWFSVGSVVIITEGLSVGTFFAGVFLGTGIMLLGIIAMTRSFSKTRMMRNWMKYTTVFIASVALLIIGIIFILYILTVQ